MLQENISADDVHHMGPKLPCIRYLVVGVPYRTVTYTLHINPGGVKPKPYSWEIFRTGEPFPFRKSAETFRSPILAKMAGQLALTRLRQNS
jgi:hypothetical protein